MMPNPLTDELSDEAKAELAAMFADMRRQYAARERRMIVRHRSTARPWQINRAGW